MNARQMGENEKLQKELQDVKKDISEMKGDSRKLRNTFLLGSLGYNIVDVAREYARLRNSPAEAAGVSLPLWTTSS